MIIAQEKRKENIIEYLLYMYQVEDTIRACGFNMDMIEQRVISQYKVNDKQRQDIRDWYSDLMVMMFQEGVKERGHIVLLKTLVTELSSLHQKLLKEKKDPKYLEQYTWALPNIKAFEKKMGKKPESEVDTCLSGLYALLLLRIQKKEVSQETLEAMQTFSNMLALLANWFRKIEEGKVEI